jgi:hypothetical protein
MDNREAEERAGISVKGNHVNKARRIKHDTHVHL